jgi:hypothetical protein
MDAYNRVLRNRLRQAIACRHLPRTDGTLYRDGAEIGAVGGYLYVRQRGGFTVSLPGQLADQPEGHYLMALYPDELPDAQEGDMLGIGDVRYQVLAIRDSGAYHTYSLGVIP